MLSCTSALRLLLVVIVCRFHQSEGFLFHSCHHVRAVVGRQGNLDMFVGDDVITFNSNTLNAIGQLPIAHRYPQWPILSPVDAAFHPINDPSSIILITGLVYYTYDSNGSRRNGPNPLSDIFPHKFTFTLGIDAAGTFNGNVYFFKGCTMIIRRPNGGDQEVDMNQAGIPCHPRAAWYDGQGLVVATEERAVRLLGNGQVSNGFCAFDQFKTHKNICGCNNH